MKKKILFLCTGNSCRSQMAEGLLRHIDGEGFAAYSAGTDPSNVNTSAIKVMSEIGIDISKQTSKSLKQYLYQTFDYVITLCDSANEVCPVFPGEYQKLHWSIEDPINAKGSEEEVLAVYRTVRSEIKKEIESLLSKE